MHSNVRLAALGGDMILLRRTSSNTDQACCPGASRGSCNQNSSPTLHRNRHRWLSDARINDSRGGVRVLVRGALVAPRRLRLQVPPAVRARSARAPLAPRRIRGSKLCPGNFIFTLRKGYARGSPIVDVIERILQQFPPFTAAATSLSALASSLGIISAGAPNSGRGECARRAEYRATRL